MMKNRSPFKKTAAILAAAILLMLVPVQTHAALTLDELQKQMEEHFESVESWLEYLQKQLQLLQDQPTSTPAPVVNPLIKLLSPQTVTVKSGTTTEIELQIRNIGTSAATAVLVQASVSGPLSVSFSNNANSIGNVNENTTRSVKLNVTADSAADAGSYQVALTFSYRDRNGLNVTDTDMFTVRIDPAAVTSPRVSLVSIKADKVNVKAGDAVNVTMNIENAGDGAAEDVRVSVTGLSSGGVYMTGDPNAAFYKNMAAGYSGSLKFELAVSPLAAGGIVPVTFVLTYRDARGNAAEVPYLYFINVTAADAAGGGRANLVANDISSPAYAVNAGANAAVSFLLVNSGSETANNIRVTAASADENALPPVTANIQIIDSLAPGETRRVSFTFSPTDYAQSRSYMISLQIEYETGTFTADNKPVTDVFHQYAGITVNNPDSQPTPGPAGFQKPRMIISEYFSNPVIVRAGREFDLSLTFQNASSQRSINNLKITMTARDTNDRGVSVFAPVNASSTFYIDKVDPKEDINRSLTFFTVPNAEQRSYTLDVRFEYQDDDFIEYVETEQISINVRQVTRLETSDMYIPADVPVYSPVYLYFSIMNTGRVSLSNMRVRIDGDVDATNANIFMGNLGRGNSIYY
ncbi:MAG: hypothetical protein FWE82_07980, partial [Defluviitaleaceae bacterium]|nr:hypothetical protein [Defluviitaleaceae bacterium]